MNDKTGIFTSHAVLQKIHSRKSAFIPYIYIYIYIYIINKIILLIQNHRISIRRHRVFMHPRYVLFISDAACRQSIPDTTWETI